MSCPKCGKPYLKVEGNQLVCSCGYVETVMTDATEDLQDYIKKWAKQNF